MRVKNIWPWVGGVVDLQQIFTNIVWSPCKIWLLFRVVCAHAEGPEKFLPRWYPPPVKEEAWLPPRNTPILHLSYHAEFGQTVGGRQGGPEIFGSDGPRPYLTP